MKTSREKLRAEYMAEVEGIFDELMVWDEQTQELDLTQKEKLQPVEQVPCPECGVRVPIFG